MTLQLLRATRVVALVALGLGGACGRDPDPGATSEKTAEAAKPEQKAVPTSVGDAPVLCEHRVPADLCTRCDADLEEVFKEKGDWCKEHSVPESQCLQCNPKLDFSKRAATPSEPYCAEHGVPEAKCTKCNPRLVAKYIEAGDYCRDHGLPESVCPFCHPEVARAAGVEPPSFPPAGLTIKLERAEIAGKAGITTEAARLESFADGIEVVGQIEFDGNRLARLSARGDALVSEIKVDVGDGVRKGQPLVVLTSAAVGESRAKRAGTATRLETARAALEREEALLARGITSKREVEEARAALSAAEQESASALAGLKAAGATDGAGGAYSLRSPIDGVVVSRAATVGLSASAGDVLIEVADVSTLWAVLDVPEDLAARVRPGQRVVLQFDRGAHVDVAAHVSRVAPAVDKHTRTVRVRAEVPNPDRSLRAGLFLRARIEVGGEAQALVIPRDAVQEVEGQRLVFVRTSDTVFEPKAVDIRPMSGNRVAVLRGLDRGALVVVAGAFLLKTEILKDSIGAGCADDH